MSIDVPEEIEKEWSQYEKLRNSGLRKQANKALLTTIAKIKSNQNPSINEFLLSLCEKGLDQDPQQRIQHPLYVQCILPLLLSGLERKSAREISFIVRSSGYGKEIYDAIGDISHRELLNIALESEPKNIDIINQLVSDYVYELYFGAHHLPEVLIVELDYAQGIIKECAEFILKNQNCVREDIVEEHKYYSNLYQDYADWKNKSHGIDFSSWCNLNRKSYSWIAAVFYD